jgi:hypothetical protein
MSRWRRPGVRALQGALVLAAAAWGFHIHRGAAAEKSGLEFSVSLLGETSGADGSRHAVDLLAHPDRSADRYQVAVTPTQPSRVMVDEVVAGQERRLYPPAGETGVVAAGRTQALPRTGGFYERRDASRVRLTVIPVGDEAALGPAGSFGSPGVETLQLSDGQAHVVSARLYQSPHGATVEADLH